MALGNTGVLGRWKKWCGVAFHCPPRSWGQLQGAWGPLAPWLYCEIQQSRARVC